jgi:hypothetical protein
MPREKKNDTDPKSGNKKDGAETEPIDKNKQVTEDARSSPSNEGMRTGRTDDDNRTLEELAEEE